MGIFNNLIKKKKCQNAIKQARVEHEFCPRCEANITLQKGYSSELPYWVCRGCGEMLINPAVPGDVAWICDKCEAMLNIQEGFTEENGTWECRDCGFVNKIDKSEMYISEDEFQTAYRSPYRGLADEAVLSLSKYSEEEGINGRDDIILVRNMDDNRLYVKKILRTYDVSVYEYLKEHPVEYMPRICEVYESDNSLIVIEEFIEGRTLQDIINEGKVAPDRAVYIARRICYAVKQLHDLDSPIIHRDIKPSNVIIGKDKEACLLDVNVAKWYKESETQDTQLLGTQYYAAPEQLGYGFMASSEKTDVYAIGMLLNVMVTGRMPKEEKADRPVWNVIEKCIGLEPDSRYSDDELIMALDSILR